jgi:hypothetical protein
MNEDIKKLYAEEVSKVRRLQAELLTLRGRKSSEETSQELIRMKKKYLAEVEASRTFKAEILRLKCAGKK